MGTCMGSCQDMLASWALQAPADNVDRPFSVYVNIHGTHASVLFLQSDLVNRQDAESQRLAELGRGLRVFFAPNSFQVINPLKNYRVDLYTNDGYQYMIERRPDILGPGTYTMCKCYEMVGFNDDDIEWAYLMAAHDWYDAGANNCLSFSKRIIRELHKQIMGGEELSAQENKQLAKLYISMPGEGYLEALQTRVSFFLNPSLQPLALLFLFVLVAVAYVEARCLRFASLSLN